MADYEVVNLNKMERWGWEGFRLDMIIRLMIDWELIVG